jgi:hypothetical protein
VAVVAVVVLFAISAACSGCLWIAIPSLAYQGYKYESGAQDSQAKQHQSSQPPASDDIARRQLHAQTLHWVCPVSAGEFLSALAGEFDVVVPGGCPMFVDVPDVVLVVDVAVLELLSPGDCPGGMKGDCGALVM